MPSALHASRVGFHTFLASGGEKEKVDVEFFLLL